MCAALVVSFVFILPHQNRPRRSIFPSLSRLCGLSGSGSMTLSNSPVLRSMVQKPELAPQTNPPQVGAQKTRPVPALARLCVARSRHSTYELTDAANQPDRLRVQHDPPNRLRLLRQPKSASRLDHHRTPKYTRFPTSHCSAQPPCPLSTLRDYVTSLGRWGWLVCVASTPYVSNGAIADRQPFSIELGAIVVCTIDAVALLVTQNECQFIA